MTETTETTAAKPAGILSALRENPATRNLLSQTKNLAKARGARLVTKSATRLTSSTDKLNGIADAGGQTSALKEGAQRLAKGDSPLKAAVAGAATSVKEKVKGVFGGGKGSGGKSGPPKATNIEESLDVGVPVSVAYDQWTQYPDFARFMKGVEAVEAKSETEQNWRVKVFKSRRSWKATVQEQIPDRRIAWTSEGAKGSTKGVVTFHPLADDLTRVLLALEYYPSGFMEKTGNIWRAGGRRARLDLKHFRRFIMRQGEATGSWRGEIQDGQVVRQPDEQESEHEDNEDNEGAATAAEGTESEENREGEEAAEGEADQPREESADDASDKSTDASRDNAETGGGGAKQRAGV